MVTASKKNAALGCDSVRYVSVNRIVSVTLSLFPRYGHEERCVTIGTAFDLGPLLDSIETSRRVSWVQNGPAPWQSEDFQLMDDEYRGLGYSFESPVRKLSPSIKIASP